MARGPAAPLTVALEASDGTLLASAVLPAPGGDWARQEAVLTASRDELKARLVVTTATAGELNLDMVSLFPRDTFRGHRNGLRKDLGEAIAAMQPKVFRFPGGCIVHGSGLDNAYRWKDTVGDVAHRRPNWNRWGYHQSYGLGYFEYMQFCEDIGATPLPILPVGVSCGFNKPYQVANDAALEPWIQDVIDLVEFANGPVDSAWGRVRAEMGHPAPFHLKYIGLGNEEHDTELFRAVFPRFVTALRARHPEIQIVGTAGLGPSIPLFDLMARAGVDISDEHYYEKPEWFIERLNRFDAVPRKTPRVYVGEYASGGNRQFNAVAEAVYLCGIERNADQVVMTAYAPLLARYGFTQWQQANLIWFDATSLVLTPNYHVQQLFASHLGDRTVPASVTFPAAGATGKKPPVLAVSPTLSSKDGTLFVKVANPMAEPVTARITVQGLGGIQPQAQLVTLAGDKDAANDLQNPGRVKPVESTLAVGPDFTLEVAAMAVQVLRVKTGR
jgi:alpha-L-arabinofuranosidase